MMQWKFVVVALALITSSMQSTASSTEEYPKYFELGSPIPIHLFGNTLGVNSTLDVFGILPPCTSEMLLSYKSDPCIKKFQYRSLASQQWLDADLEMSSLESTSDTSAALGNYNPTFSETRWTDNRWYLHGGAASLWSAKIDQSGSEPRRQRFLIEATVGPISSAKKFSLSLVPVEITTAQSRDLSEMRPSRLQRVPFPKNFEYQIMIKQGQSMQPLQFVTSRTKDAEIINTAGPKVTVPEFIFRGKAQTHSVLTTAPLYCKDELVVKILRGACDSRLGYKVKVYPWDRAILEFLSDEVVDSLKETSSVEEWTFQGGQDSPLITDFTTGCSYTNVFSLVSTNAPIYHINPPRWDKQERTLSVKVANTHLNASSEPQVGSFSIALRLSSAACMWGIDRASASASVEVVSEDGVAQKFSTSSIRIDEAADTVAINLAGFTFSSPSVKIRLMSSLQPKETSTKRLKGKFITISCSKGKVVKKVTSKTPKCPEGFKKI